MKENNTGGVIIIWKILEIQGAMEQWTMNSAPQNEQKPLYYTIGSPKPTVLPKTKSAPQYEHLKKKKTLRKWPFLQPKREQNWPKKFCD